MTKIASTLPSDDKNGLPGISHVLADSPEDEHLAIIVIDTKHVTIDTDTGEAEATARIRAIEPMIEPGDIKAAGKLLAAAHRARTGAPAVDLFSAGRTDG